MLLWMRYFVAWLLLLFPVISLFFVFRSAEKQIYFSLSNGYSIEVCWLSLFPSLWLLLVATVLVLAVCCVSRRLCGLVIGLCVVDVLCMCGIVVIVVVLVGGGGGL